MMHRPFIVHYTLTKKRLTASMNRFGRTAVRPGGRFRLLPIILFAIYGLYYYFSNQEEVAITGRSQIVDMSREQEATLGLQSYRPVSYTHLTLPTIYSV